MDAAISGGTTLSVTIEALVAALVSMLAAARAYWAMYQSVSELKTQTASLKKAVDEHETDIEQLKKREWRRQGAETARSEVSNVAELPRVRAHLDSDPL